ncbi:DUF7093 family protein [Halogeometricum limi]|uniref:Uncharacterized protein n=1 Tax=Halogeometricum limi TaxID=555875 RepID=A0A1I6FYG7_9EURY|nr:hypothetical protein [Halogeometricum limi]SFR34954.1 hypothetical protein SAMN04488124_0542 [Halogeometricum limi]
MGLKCRLLGHQYGDPEIEREREENGDEVVVTIREVQVCQRCGTEHVVSENKEITSIRSPADVGLDESAAAAPEAADPVAADDAPAGPETTPTDAGSPIAEAEPGAESGDAAPGAEEPDEVTADTVPETFGDDDDFEPPENPEEDDAVILGDEEETERDETQWPEDAGPDPATAAQESAAVEGDQPVDPDPAPADSGDAVTDDAEFIDADEVAAEESETATDRGHGEWPERDDTESEPAWPVHEGEDEGFASQPSDGTPAEVSFGSGLTPEANGQLDHDHDAGDEAEYITAGDDGGFTRAESQSDLQSDVPDDEIEFYCPNCGHARTAGASSMRAGDICPECKRGYIAERQL